MALRKRGKSGFWHAYFRAIRAGDDGKLHGVTTTVNLGTADLREARALEAELMARNREVALHQRVKSRMIRMEIAAGKLDPAEDPGKITPAHRVKRLRICDAIEVACRYRPLGETTRKRWRQFEKRVPAKWMNEVTPGMAFDFLMDVCPDVSKGKNYNNIKSALNAVFRLTLMDSGIDQSPFEKIPNRVANSRHQRPVTDDEFRRIFQAAQEPWKSAALIAFFTGLREKDVFLLRWDQIDGGVITTTPAKTARFGRAVQIPIHPQLAAWLDAMDRRGDRILGSWPYRPNDITFRREFGRILEKAEVHDDDSGIVTFGSLRDSFVTRCDAAGIARHAIRGMVGHVSDEMTDLYSHDLESARKITDLPEINLET